MHIHIDKFLKRVWEIIKSIFHKKDEQEDIPEPSSSSSSDPEPQPPTDDFIPPDRIVRKQYVGYGKFNTFKEEYCENPTTSVTLSAWIFPEEWSGGNSEQGLGCAVLNKGQVGNHWGISLTARPDALVWNATRGEIKAKCSIPLKKWSHVQAKATKDKIEFWLNGKKLISEKKTFAGDLFQNSDEPLRIGGYYCPWPNATWFNQSIKGQIQDWTVELK